MKKMLSETDELKIKKMHVVDMLIDMGMKSLARKIDALKFELTDLEWVEKECNKLLTLAGE